MYTNSIFFLLNLHKRNLVRPILSLLCKFNISVTFPPNNREHFIHFITCTILACCMGISSVQFSCSFMSDSLRPHESQHARPPCPSPSPRVHSNSRPSSRLCHPAVSSSVIPFSSCPQSLPASESFPMSQLFTRGGPSTGVSALASFLPKKSQC